jgi:hypothetical protein
MSMYCRLSCLSSFLLSSLYSLDTLTQKTQPTTPNPFTTHILTHSEGEFLWLEETAQRLGRNEYKR